MYINRSYMAPNNAIIVDPNSTYRISFSLNIPDWGIDIWVAPGDSSPIYSGSFWAPGVTTITETFQTPAWEESGPVYLFMANYEGDRGDEPAPVMKIDNISIRKESDGVDENIPIKEFLVGNTDEGGVIFFRADTQILQIQPSPQMYSNPIAIVTEMERGTQTKAFISLDDKPFFQLEGTVTKGISILKPATSSNINSLDDSKPPLAQSIQLSYRDSSKNLCRLIQTAVITNPTSIDYVE